MSALSTNPAAAVGHEGLHLIVRCIVGCGYQQHVVDFAGRYCPYCAQDVEHEVDERHQPEMT